MGVERVNRSLPIEGTRDRVVLFSWSTSREAKKRNLVRLDSDGTVVWRAELPGEAASDCFNSLARDGDGFVARTYSEWVVRLDADGRVRHKRREPAAV